jgi:hypothetical protein
MDEAMRRFKIVVERHSDGYVAYPLGVMGAIVGEGDTAADALADVTSAIRFSIEIFGPEICDEDGTLLDACVVEASVP